MFNNVDWKSGRFSSQIKHLRMFEHTEDRIAREFRRGDGRPRFDLLTGHPCIFCEEGKADEIAYVGHIRRPRISGEEVSLEISLSKNVQQFPNSLMYESRKYLGMDSIEFYRNHWAVKEASLLHFLRSSALVSGNGNVIDERGGDSSFVSAMMPFDQKFVGVYDSIHRAADSIGLECKRADNTYMYPSFIRNIIFLITDACLVVCDCTELNPNVLYEMGFAHGVKQCVIPITQNGQNMPSNLNQLVYIEYQNTPKGREKLTKDLISRMEMIIEQQRSGTLDAGAFQIF